MRRLTSYISRLFATDAVILFGVVCFLLWLINCLRSFDVVSVKGQGLGTLAYQAFLTMPSLATAFFYICVGIGMARALQAMQASRELHIIHTSHGMGSLWRATGVVTLVGVLGALLLSNFLEPYAYRRLNALNATVAADFVSSTLRPGRFTQVTPGVVLLIGGRSGNGEIQEFFADDRRDPNTRRTYIAESAVVSQDGDNYVLELQNGALQQTQANGRYSEVTFSRYDVNVDSLSQELGRINPLLEQDSIALLHDALTTGKWPKRLPMILTNRMAEGLRVVAITLMVLALVGFPSGRRSRFMVPMEATVLGIAFAERGLSAYSPLGAATGAIVLIIISGVVLFIRCRPRPTPMIEVAA